MAKTWSKKGMNGYFGIVIRTIFLVCVAGGSLYAQPASWAVDGTTGAPLGGIGTGSVKFCSHNGSFAGTFAASAHQYDFSALTNMQFQFFSDRGGVIQTNQKLSAVITAGRADDDAIYPVQYANFGTINGVAVRLTAFAPYDPANVSRMCYPYAFYELNLVNTQATAVTAAVALQTQTSANPSIVANKGLRTTADRALYASSGKAGATLSVGSDNGFMTSGACANTITGTTNKVAMRVTLAANDSATVRFVFAWSNADTTLYWYKNAGSNAAAFADTGLVYFDAFKAKATEFVTRMRSSNMPSWLTNQTQNSLCNLTNNSLYTKDGRHCYTEGQWDCNGTMDQMWHARQINTMVVPALAWQELSYWARTQKTSTVGQIHHDFLYPTLVAWDDQNHLDYSYRPNIDNWVDLNCGFILSVYEAFIATDDHTRLDWFWPYVKKAAQRIINQTVAYPAAGYPLTFQGSDNSYDAGGDPNAFNASMSAVAYKVMTRLAAIQSEPTLVTRYQGAFDTVSQSFTMRYLTNNFPIGRISESVLGGQWIAYYLKLGDLFPKQAIDYGLVSEDSYYRPLVTGFFSATKTYNEWGPYLVSHLGGLYLQTGNQDRWRAMQFDYSTRTFYDRNMVYNTYLDIPPLVTTPTYLATAISGSNQYISMPVLWRNYYTLVGFQRNKHSGEVWLEPVVLQELNHSMTNALLPTPEGYVTVSCAESGQKFQNRTIVAKCDNPMSVLSVYLRDDYGQNVTVTVDGVSQTFTRIGSGYQKELRVAWNGSIGPSGTTIVVSGDTSASETLAFMTFPRNPYKRFEAELYTSASSGIQTEPCGDVGGTSNVGYTANNSYIAFDSLNFQYGAVACTLRVAAAAGGGGTVELRLDNATGTLIGTATIPSTGGWQTYATVSCPVTGVTGIKRLYCVFKTTNPYVGNVNWLVFKPEPVGIIDRGRIADVKRPLLENRDGTVSITLSGAMKHSIRVFGVNGKCIRVINAPGAGRFTFGIRADDKRNVLKAGTYIIAVSSPVSTVTRKIAVY